MYVQCSLVSFLSVCLDCIPVSTLVTLAVISEVVVVDLPGAWMPFLS